MSLVLIALILVWLGLLAAGYCCTRFGDPWPRDLLRVALHQRFAQECLTWKVFFLAECLVILVVILVMSWAFVCASISLRIVRLLLEMRGMRLRYSEPGPKNELDEVNPDHDPILDWYRSSWKLDFGKLFLLWR